MEALGGLVLIRARRKIREIWWLLLLVRCGWEKNNVYPFSLLVAGDALLFSVGGGLALIWNHARSGWWQRVKSPLTPSLLSGGEGPRRLPDHLLIRCLRDSQSAHVLMLGR